MLVDCVRLYQKPEGVKTGCDSGLFPTQTHINKWVSLLICSCLVDSDDTFPRSPTALPLAVGSSIHEPGLCGVGGRFRAPIPKEQFQG